MKTKEIVLHELARVATGHLRDDTQASDETYVPQSKGEAPFVSGADLAKRCGISRQAVWKAVETLRKDGLEIEAAPKIGYRLLQHISIKNNALSSSYISLLLPPSISAKIFVYGSIDSTNIEAKRLCEAAIKSKDGIHALDGTVIIADCQTAGRGRLGRKFFSPKGTGLYISIIHAPEKNITMPAVLTASAAVAVSRAIHGIYGVEPQIKWVNDIFLHGKKVCGILTEGATNFETGTIDYAIVGIGINVLPGSFPSDIKNIATSIFTEENSKGADGKKIFEAAKKNPRRNELAARIIMEVISIFQSDREGFADAMKEYREKSFLIGKTVTITPLPANTKNSFEAKVLDITDDAKLVVQKSDGNITQLDSAEVTSRAFSS